MAALETELASATRELRAVRRELRAMKRSRPAAPTVASAFALLAHEVASGPVAKDPVGRLLAAALRRAEALLSRTWPAVQARGGAASSTCCWFGNRVRPTPAATDPGGGSRPRKRAAVPPSGCLLAALPQQVLLRVLIHAVGGMQRGMELIGMERGLAGLRAAARAFAFPQLCFPASQPLVAHARSLVVRAKREAAFRAAVPVEISGAKGDRAMRINGVFERTRERRRGCVVYRKRGDDDAWLCMTQSGWIMQDAESKAADNEVGFFGSFSEDEQALAPSPLGVPSACWEVFNNGVWENQGGGARQP